MAHEIHYNGMKHLFETILNVLAFAGLTISRITASGALTILSLIVAVTAIAVNVTRLLDWWDDRKEKT